MMHNESKMLRQDLLPDELRREAYGNEPSFSPELNERIMTAIRVQASGSSGDVYRFKSKTSTPFLRIAIAVAAVLLIGMTTFLVTMPELASVARPPDSTSAVEMAAAISDAASSSIDEFVQARLDELVDSVVSNHVQFLGQHADEIAEFLLDPLPIAIDSTSLD